MASEIIEAFCRSCNAAAENNRHALLALTGAVDSALNGVHEKAYALANQLFRHLRRDAEGGLRE